jgi:hypothetical protein
MIRFGDTDVAVIGGGMWRSPHAHALIMTHRQMCLAVYTEMSSIRLIMITYPSHLEPGAWVPGDWAIPGDSDT